MALLRGIRCMIGWHERSRGLAWSDTRTFHSQCKHCGKPMIRTVYGWRIDHDPPPPPPAR